MQKKMISLLLAAFLLAVALPLGASAAGAGFSVSANIPANQIGSNSGYFDLLMEPGQVQDISVTVTNESDEAIVVVVEAYTASTNRNGVVDYSSHDGLYDDSLPYRFSDLVEVKEKSLTIPARESRDAVATITMPDSAFDGILLGSIQVLQEVTEEEKASGAMILNQFSYGTAVHLQVNQNPVEPEFTLGEVRSDLVNYRASIVANVHNTRNMGFKDATVMAQIYPKNSDTAIFESVQERVTFAPNTIFPFTFQDDAGYGIAAGDYDIHVVVNYQDKTWEFDQAFTIDAQEAATMNNNAMNQNEQTRTAAGSLGIPVWVIIAIIAGVVIIIVVIILVVTMGKKNKMMMETYQAILQQQQSMEPKKADSDTKEQDDTQQS